MESYPAVKSDNRLFEMLATACYQIKPFLDDDRVVEIMLNPDQTVWIDRLGEGLSKTNVRLSPDEARRIIYLVAHNVNTVCNDKNPDLKAEFPKTGNRFQGILPPLVTSPLFTLRIKARLIISLDEYVFDGIMSNNQKKVIIQAVQERKNILVVGGTGSGKTTLVNAILAEIAKTNERIVLIEDTQELQCAAENKVELRTSDNRTMDDLLKITLRLRPDRIVVGEVRGPEALALLDAWNTGHPGGICTIHANSAADGLIRLESLIQRVSINSQQRVIASAINMIIFIQGGSKGRKIKEIIRVEGLDKTGYILKPIE